MLRNLAAKLVLWLCARFDIVPLDETRKFMGADKVARGQRWEAFYTEDGGLADMIREIRTEAFEAAAETPPQDIETLHYWTTADRTARLLEQKVRSVIQSGKVAANNNEARERLSVGPARKSI